MLVAQCPQLEYAQLHADEDRHPRGLNPEMVRHATLRQLAVDQSPTAENSLYRLLDLPALSRLRIEELESNMDDALGFLERHSFLLELELDVNELEALNMEELQRLCGTFPSLRGLSLDSNAGVDMRTREAAGVSQLLFDVLNQRDASGNFAFFAKLEKVSLLDIVCERDVLEVTEVMEG